MCDGLFRHNGTTTSKGISNAQSVFQHGTINIGNNFSSGKQSKSFGSVQNVNIDSNQPITKKIETMSLCSSLGSKIFIYLTLFFFSASFIQCIIFNFNKFQECFTILIDITKEKLWYFPLFAQFREQCLIIDSKM